MNPVRAQAEHPGAAICYSGLRALGATALRRRFQNAGLILCYHNVVARGDARVGDPGLHVPREQFEQQVRWLVDHYEVLSLREFVERLAGGGRLRSTAVLTFDDAYAGVFEHAVPLLDRLGIPATVFVVAEAPGRAIGFWWDQPDVVNSLTPARREKWLNRLRGDEAAILSDIQACTVTSLPPAYRPAAWSTIRAHAGHGIDFGVHSATHRSLPTLTDVELEHEVVTSRAIIHRATGRWPEFFAYPYGLWDARIRGIVCRAGYRAAFGLGAGLNGAAADLWCLRRVNVPATISPPAFEAWSAGFRLRGKN